MSFEKELESLLNRYSKENESNTPDWVLSDYIQNCLAAFNTATQQREAWYGRDPRPSVITDPDPGPLVKQTDPAPEEK